MFADAPFQRVLLGLRAISSAVWSRSRLNFATTSGDLPTKR